MRKTLTHGSTIDAAFMMEFFGEYKDGGTSYDISIDNRINQRLTGDKCCNLAGIRKSKVADRERVVDIWRGAVDATHHFLHPEDRRDIEVEVVAFLPTVSLWLAVDNTDAALGFMLLEGSCMEALFVDPLHRGSGIGRALIQHALTFHSTITTEVNEQNSQAVGFYCHLGFERVGYSQHDQQGRPYPLIHLRKSLGIE